MASAIGSSPGTTLILSTSARRLHDERMATPYPHRMRRLDEIPHTDPVSAWERLIRRYPSNSDTGRRLRQSVAKTWLRDMDAVATEIAAREVELSAIVNRTTRMQAEHELNMQCLVHFGVTLHERETLRTILEEVSRSGHLTIREAVQRAHVAAQRNGDSFVAGGVSSVPPLD